MRIKSFYKDGHELKPLELEIALWPGLPSIQFVGQADQHLKESAFRIKSALKASGFEFPVAQQILVNLKPTHIRKSSRGLELAVALAYLWKTGQIDNLILDEGAWIYGELGLSGQIDEPADLIRADLGATDYVITGTPREESAGMGAPFRRRVAKSLSLLADIREIAADDQIERRLRPGLIGPAFVSETEARFLKIMGVGGHHALLAGPSGSGKSTLARMAYGLMPELLGSEAQELRKDALDFGFEWRPLIEPHHSTPRMSMIGGGNPPQKGEVARAHRGLLILDELLEFDGEVLEALREPFENGELRVGRLSGVQKFKAQAQILATTNLCPCGDLVPGKGTKIRCRFSLKKCRSYSERLSGPLLDRFQVLYFSGQKLRPERDIAVVDIQSEVLRVQAWQLEQRGLTLNRLTDGVNLWKGVEPLVQKLGFTSQNLSERRRLAALRVARSIADLDGDAWVRMHHFEEALAWAVEPFQSLNRWQVDLIG